MSRYLLKQIGIYVPSLLILTLFVFLLVYLVPGDPALALLGQTASPETIEAFRQKMQLDEPFIVQYATWLSQVLHGNLGRSVRTKEPVLEALVERLPVTVHLAFYALSIAIVIGLPLGVMGAVHRNTLWDLGSQVLGIAGLSIPSFFMAILCILLFALKLKILPAVGYVSPLEAPLRSMKTLFLPAFSLSFATAGVISRMTRSSMMEVLHEDYVRTARSKGLSERVCIYKHALRNALIPVVTICGLQLGFALGGTIVIESIFGLPGMGRFMLHALNGQDFPMVQGVLLFLAITRLLINLMTDIAYAVLDPKVRFQ